MTAETDRLADELREVLGALLRRMRAEPAGNGLTWPQLPVLRRLEEEGPRTTAELARAEAITPQSMGVLVAELEQAGFVERRDDPADGRRRLVHPTPLGREARASGRAARRGWLAQTIERRLDAEEQRRLLEAVALLRRLLEP
jgi:DNA-binding MarR family transcriptional regulator